MIIHLTTMTDQEILHWRDEVFDVYSNCVDAMSFFSYSTTKNKYGELAYEAWGDLETLWREWERRGHDGHTFLMGAGFGPKDDEHEEPRDPEAAVVRELVCSVCGCNLGPAWLQTDKSKPEFCVDCFDKLPVDDTWKYKP